MFKQIPPSLQNAFQSFRMAENEMNRPHEDAVAFCACHNMRNCVNIFLLSFLADNAVQVSGEKKFEDLLKYCKKIDSQFKAIDLSCFNCKHDGATNCDEKYCLSIKKVNECFVQTKMVKNLVLAKLKISEKELA
jgi:hypothetical protein